MINGNSDLRSILKPAIGFMSLLRIRRKNIGPVVVQPGKDFVIVSTSFLLVYQIMRNHMKSLLSEETFNLLDALRSPVLTQSVSWADCIPDRLLEIIPHARLGMLFGKKYTASDPEIVAFIMTASMEYPLTSEWVDIYTHLSCKVAQDYWKEDHWNNVQAPRELSDYSDKYLLNPLRLHIYEKRRKILKSRLKDEKEIKPISPIECLIQKTPDLMEQQLQLF
jgi:hypothetical protein